MFDDSRERTLTLRAEVCWDLVCRIRFEDVKEAIDEVVKMDTMMGHRTNIDKSKIDQSNKNDPYSLPDRDQYE